MDDEIGYNPERFRFFFAYMFTTEENKNANYQLLCGQLQLIRQYNEEEFGILKEAENFVLENFFSYPECITEALFQKGGFFLKNKFMPATFAQNFFNKFGQLKEKSTLESKYFSPTQEDTWPHFIKAASLPVLKAYVKALDKPYDFFLDLWGAKEKSSHLKKTDIEALESFFCSDEEKLISLREQTFLTALNEVIDLIELQKNSSVKLSYRQSGAISFLKKELKYPNDLDKYVNFLRNRMDDLPSFFLFERMPSFIEPSWRGLLGNICIRLGDELYKKLYNCSRPDLFQKLSVHEQLSKCLEGWSRIASQKELPENPNFFSCFTSWIFHLDYDAIKKMKPAQHGAIRLLLKKIPGEIPSNILDQCIQLQYSCPKEERDSLDFLKNLLKKPSSKLANLKDFYSIFPNPNVSYVGGFSSRYISFLMNELKKDCFDDQRKFLIGIFHLLETNCVKQPLVLQYLDHIRLSFPSNKTVNSRKWLQNLFQSNNKYPLISFFPDIDERYFHNDEVKKQVTEIMRFLTDNRVLSVFPEENNLKIFLNRICQIFFLAVEDKWSTNVMPSGYPNALFDHLLKNHVIFSEFFKSKSELSKTIVSHLYPKQTTGSNAFDEKFASFKLECLDAILKRHQKLEDDFLVLVETLCFSSDFPEYPFNHVYMHRILSHFDRFKLNPTESIKALDQKVRLLILRASASHDPQNTHNFRIVRCVERVIAQLDLTLDKEDATPFETKEEKTIQNLGEAIKVYQDELLCDFLKNQATDGKLDLSTVCNTIIKTISSVVVQCHHGNSQYTTLADVSAPVVELTRLQKTYQHSQKRNKTFNLSIYEFVVLSYRAIWRSFSEQEIQKQKMTQLFQVFRDWQISGQGGTHTCPTGEFHLLAQTLASIFSIPFPSGTMSDLLHQYVINNRESFLKKESVAKAFCLCAEGEDYQKLTLKKLLEIDDFLEGFFEQYLWCLGQPDLDYLRCLFGIPTLLKRLSNLPDTAGNDNNRHVLSFSRIILTAIQKDLGSESSSIPRDFNINTKDDLESLNRYISDYVDPNFDESFLAALKISCPFKERIQPKGSKKRTSPSVFFTEEEKEPEKRFRNPGKQEASEEQDAAFQLD